MRAEPSYQIGQVAKAVGLNPRTIRYYERCGLLRVGRTLSRYRTFQETDVTRLKLIKQLRRLGFSISETTQVLPVLLDRSPKSQRTQNLNALLTKRLSMARQHLGELTAIYKELEAKLQQVGRTQKRTQDACCEPFCGPETCGPGLVQISGLTRQGKGGGGG